MGKKINEAREKVERGKEYSIEDAIGLVKKASFTKFNETIDMAVNLGIDAKKQTRWSEALLSFLMGQAKR